MRYQLFLILFSTLLLAAPSSHAQEQRYRIELLVLRHLDGSSELLPQDELRDFSTALDLQPPIAEEAEDDNPAETRESAAVGDAKLNDALLNNGEPGDLEVASLPPVILVETPSETMQQAWRRLRGSAGMRPEYYLSWEQAGEAPFPLVRVHDAELLFEDDPYADLREGVNPGENASGEFVFTDTDTVNGNSLPTETDSMEDELPDPLRFYRIDGTAKFTRSRFIHLYLDIEFREPIYDRADNVGAENAGSDFTPTVSGNEETAIELPFVYRVHHIDQNRQVHIQDVEYFDGPVIAVLAYITRADSLPEEDGNGADSTP